MMAFRYLRQSAIIVSLLNLTNAQQSNIVPEDLRGGFRSSGTEVQVSYTNEAVNGFKDGTLFNKDAVAQEPTFALGDSSGITPTTLYTMIMLDTTCPNKRVLHYARSNFKNNFEITRIDTKSAAVLEYAAPGSKGETGDNRQYTFLMYVNPQRKQIDSLKLPADGEAFDAKKFQDDNGFQEPKAGVGMVVKLGGTADCGSDQPNSVPENLPSPRPARSSGQTPRPTSVAGGQPQGASSAANSSPTPSSTSNNGTTPDNGSGNAPALSGGRSSGLAVATTLLQSNGGVATPTAVFVSGSPAGGAGASNTANAQPAQQTTNAALQLGAGGLGLLAPFVAIAGLVMW